MLFEAEQAVQVYIYIYICVNGYDSPAIFSRRRTGHLDAALNDNGNDDCKKIVYLPWQTICPINGSFDYYHEIEIANLASRGVTRI
jgi:hypothetical protein